ncbi:MAG: glycosyltransferase [Thermoplasmataceae archaeon]
MLYLYLEIALLVISFISFAFYMFSAGFSLFFREDQKVYPNSMSQLTVVIPVYREDPASFRNTLESVKQNGANFIVVGDRCSSPYREITEDLGGKFYENANCAGKKGAMATGISHVNSKFVLFLDSDTVLPENGAQKLLDRFAPDVGGVSGIIRIKKDGRGLSYSAEFVERTREVILRSMNSHGNVMILDGCCSAYRTELVKQFILGEEFLNDRFMGRPVITGDDRKLTGFVIRSGFRAVRNFSVNVEVSAPGNISGYLKQQVRWARSGWLSFFRDIHNGTAKKGGRFYNVNLLYVYVVPLIAFIIIALRTTYPLIHFIDAHFTYFIGHVPEVMVYFFTRTLTSMIFVEGTADIGFIRIISMTLTVIGMSVFGIAISDIMIKERLKTFVYGALALALMFFVNVYGLMTIWKQSSWLTRPAGPTKAT